MIIELFRDIEQLPEEMACPAMLIRQKSECRFEPKCQVEKPPVQSPLIVIRQ